MVDAEQDFGSGNSFFFFSLFLFIIKISLLFVSLRWDLWLSPVNFSLWHVGSSSLTGD